MARHETEQDKMDSAVERSLDDFIARANTTLPPIEAPAPRAAAGSTRARKPERPEKKQPKGKTLVVVGSQKPLAEETEIVSRLPMDLLQDEPPRKGWFSLRLGLAFLAGAAAVLVVTRLIAGSPEPMQPVAAPVAPPPSVTVPPPPIVVEPMAVTPPPPAPAAVAEAQTAVAPAAIEPAPLKRRARAQKPAPTSAPAPKKPSGLVDPFAQ